jgi:hypothetical protein
MSPDLSSRSATKRGYTPLASTSTLNLDECPIDAPLRTEGLYRVYARTGDGEDKRCESLLLQRTRDSLDILREKYRGGKDGYEEFESEEGKRRGKMRCLANKGREWIVCVGLRGVWRKD